MLVRSWRRLTGLILCAALLIAAGPLGRAAPAPRCGDVDADGAVTAADALTALQHAVRLRTLTGEAFLRADVDGNGVVNAADALLMLQVSVRLIDRFPVEADTVKGMYDVTYTRREDGLYDQHRDAVTVEGPRTVTTTDRLYAPSMHIMADAAGVSLPVAESWKQAGFTVYTGGGSYNHAASEYVTSHPEDNQMDAEGNTGVAWNSLVLTPQAIDFKLQNEVLPGLTWGSRCIGYSEPEMFRRGLYGEGYKALWKQTFGTDWADPISSPAAVFASQRLNTSTHVNAIRTWAAAVHAVQGVEFSIATHSIPAYTAYPGGITATYNHQMATGAVDRVTGQTWSNTMLNLVPFEGERLTDTFLQGFVGYGSYLDAAQATGAKFFALDDAMSDTANGQNEDYWRLINHDQLVSSALYGEIDRWEFIWANRSFMFVSPAYRSEQLNVHQAMKDLAGQPYTLTAGTPGIAYLLSDTLSWQIEGDGWCENAYDGFYGVAAPLIKDGIPLRTKAMELLEDPADLDGVQLLIVSYDNMKPLSETVNTAVAAWVKAGGTLLLLGGPDAYTALPDEWWNAPGKGGSPTQNLLDQLGLRVTARRYGEGPTTLVWTDGEADSRFDDTVIVGQDRFTYQFEGEGMTPVITSLYDDVLAFDAAVGRGHVVAAGLPTHFDPESRAGSSLMRILTAYALRHTAVTYATADRFVARRGRYTAARGLSGDSPLPGRYLDIFSPTLEPLEDPVLQAGQSRLLVDAPQDLSVPRLGYTGGETDELTEEADRTRLTVRAAENALIASRFYAAAGLVPKQVTAVDAHGVAQTPATRWDAATSTLLVQVFAAPADPVTLTVEWGNGTPGVKDRAYQTLSFAVSDAGEDAPYIFRNTATAAYNRRYTDADTELIYRFDLSGSAACRIALSLFANYRIEVSPDAENWTAAIDFSQEWPERVSVQNTAVRVIDPAAFGIRGVIYVRLCNTDPTCGWGGALNRVTLQYLPAD